MNSEFYACYRHWNQLPGEIRRAIIQAYVSGQTAQTASADWHAASKKAIEFWEQLHQRVSA